MARAKVEEPGSNKPELKKRRRDEKRHSTKVLDPPPAPEWSWKVTRDSTGKTEAQSLGLALVAAPARVTPATIIAPLAPPPPVMTEAPPPGATTPPEVEKGRSQTFLSTPLKYVGFPRHLQSSCTQLDLNPPFPT